MFAKILKANPYHGADGRFTSGAGAETVSSWGKGGSSGGSGGGGSGGKDKFDKDWKDSFSDIKEDFGESMSSDLPHGTKYSIKRIGDEVSTTAEGSDAHLDELRDFASKYGEVTDERLTEDDTGEMVEETIVTSEVRFKPRKK